MSGTNPFPLPRALPEEVGIPSAAVAAFLESLRQGGEELHSLMLLRNDRVALETWWKPYDPELPHELRSGSKSFAATAVGFAVQEGLMSVDDPVLGFFPSDAPARPSENLASMRVRHLLTMSSGHERSVLNPEVQRSSRNWVKTILAAPVTAVPGTLFIYNGGASYLLSAIVQRLTGQRLIDYLGPRLFEPLGIVGATWETCPRGIDIGSSGLALKTEDLAKFGLLYLRQGVWNGRRLLSEAWVEEATRAHVSTGDRGADEKAHGYGYQFWRNSAGGYRAHGLFGQLCVVLPEHDAVCAVTAATGRADRILEAIRAFLLPAMAPRDVKVVKRHAASLRRALASCRLEAPVTLDGREAERNVEGRTYGLEDNDTGLRSVGFSFRRGRLILEIRGRRKSTFRCGAGRWASGKVHGSPVRCAYAWKADLTLEAVIRRVTTPFTEAYVFRFAGDGVEVTTRNNAAGHSKEIGPIRGRRT